MKANAAHPTYQAMIELGRVQKTIFLARYLRGRALQREIHEGLNVVESWNRAVAIDPRQYDALFNAGLVEGRAGHVNEAKSALSRFVATAPKDRYGADIVAARQALQALQ